MNYREEIEKSTFIITEAGNLINPSLFVMRKNGYKLGAYDSSTETVEQITWYAVKEKRIFTAYDPLTLLGIVSLWENLGDDWRKIPKVNIHDDLLTEIFSNE